MNKYHKCMSELGRSMSGWVKVGAVAIGVGVGGWSPGGGQYARANSYRLEVQSKQGVCSFLAEDLGAGKKGELVLKEQKVEKCNDFMSNTLGFHSGASGVSFRLGSFSVYFRGFQCVVVSGGSRDDSISISSEIHVEVAPLCKVYADTLLFENTPSACLQSKLLCSSLVFLKCSRVLLYKLASISADCVFVSDSTVVNQGALKCGCLLPYDDCHLSGFEKAKIGLRSNCRRKEMVVLEGVDRSDEESGAFCDFDDNGVVAWMPFDEKTSIPFACQNDCVFREYNGGKECFYKIQNLKEPICAFVGKVRDVCGSSVPAHEKKIRFCITDSSGKILGSLVQGSIKTGHSFARVICPLRLKGATDKISFKLLGEDCKCPRSVIDSESSVIFWAEID